jgi:hypothetical protein
MQESGNLEKCWQLSTAASYVCVALGGRYLASLSTGPAVDEAVEACHTLCMCYILDKSLSMSLGRPSSLPEMELHTSSLLPNLYETPGTLVIAAYLEFARVQDAIILESRRKPQSDYHEKRVERLRQLQQDMRQIRIKTKEVCYLGTLRFVWECKVDSESGALDHLKATMSFYAENGWEWTFCTFQL